MNDNARTAAFVGIALGLIGLVIVTRPALPAAAVYEDQGQAFYPKFTDPLAATSLEVTDWDETAAKARHFKVEFKDGRYVIPSKSSHPADAKDRLAKTAASMIGLSKEGALSDNPKDHEGYGVLDPAEAGAGTAGRGVRVILRDSTGQVLSDLIFGKGVKDKTGMKYVRVPGQRRVYEAKATQDISAKFSDWVETDLLQVSAAQLKKIELNTYTIDEEAEIIKNQEALSLSKDAQGAWRMEMLAPGEELKKESADEIASALDELKIVDVRRKPEPLAAYFRGDSKGVRQQDLGSLAQCGFYVQQGHIFANEGEMKAFAEDGVLYHLWFGEVVADADDGKEAGKESRYLLIQSSFDEGQFPPLLEPLDTKSDGTAKTDDEKKKEREEYDFKKKERESKVEAGKKREKDLARRFGDWYYVISAEHFKKLRKTKAELTKKAEEKKPEEQKAPEMPTPDKPK